MDFSMNNNALDPNVGMTESIIHEHQLPKLIGPEKWRDLARMLDFSQNEIDIISEKNNCPKECCIAVLVKWIHRGGQDATVGKLVDALTKIELKSVADVLLSPINGKKTISIEVRGTIEVDNTNQIIFGNDSTGRSTFFVWETKTKEFHTSLKEIKDYIYIIDQVVGNTPKQTEQVVVEDLTCKVNQISEDIENLQKTLSDIKSSLDMPELKGETFTMQGKLEFIGKQSRTLEEVYSKVTRMTGRACACDKFVRRQFYDFTFCNLKAVHDDLNARVAALKSADTNLTKEENEKLQILLADQRGREKQVEQLEATRAQLFLSAEEEQRISQYSTPERRKSAPSIPVQEIKDYMNTTDQFSGNTHKQTEQVVVEDLTCSVTQISESIENLQKTLSDIKSSLDMPELKGETFTMQGKLEFIGKQSRTLEEVYSKVTRMTGQACACDKFVRRQFYDFTFCNLKAVHDDLNARVADLKSADTNLTKEENEKLQILLADQRGREKQVEQLEATRAQLFLSAEEEQRISQYSTPERRKSAPSIPVQEIKDHINTTDQFAGNTHKQTEQVVVEDLTCTVNKISENIEKLQKTLADIKSSLEVPELKGETFTMKRKSEFIGKHNRTLEEVYTKVTRMTDQACAFKEFVRKQFYDFNFYNLKVAHSDLNAHVADLKSVDTNFTKEENEKLQILLADQRGREKQVEQLETTQTQLFSTAEEEQRISQYSTSERRKSAPSIPVQLPSANTDGVSPRKSTKIKRNKTWSLFRSWRKSSEIPAVKGSENMCNLVSYSQKAPEDS